MEMTVIGVGQGETARLDQLDRRKPRLPKLVGEPLVVRPGVVRHPQRDPGCPTPSRGYTTDAEAAALDPAVDLVVEVARAAIGAGCLSEWFAGRFPMVTANQELPTWHGPALRRTARAAGTDACDVWDVWTEASVGGAIPVRRTLDRSWPGYIFHYGAGVLNGTVNYVVEQMGAGHRIPAVVAAAQSAGLAEEDPQAELSGLVAERKLSMLMHRALGVAVCPKDIPTPGDWSRGRPPGPAVEAARLPDEAPGPGLARVHRRRWRGGTRRRSNGPPRGHLSGAENAVLLFGPDTGEALLMGGGARGGPTASAGVAAARVRCGHTRLSWCRTIHDNVPWVDRPLDAGRLGAPV